MSSLYCNPPGLCDDVLLCLNNEIMLGNAEVETADTYCRRQKSVGGIRIHKVTTGVDGYIDDVPFKRKLSTP